MSYGRRRRGLKIRPKPTILAGQPKQYKPICANASGSKAACGKVSMTCSWTAATASGPGRFVSQRARIRVTGGNTFCDRRGSRTPIHRPRMPRIDAMPRIDDSKNAIWGAKFTYVKFPNRRTEGMCNPHKSCFFRTVCNALFWIGPRSGRPCQVQFSQTDLSGLWTGYGAQAKVRRGDPPWPPCVSNACS